jgi:hypothetical protein
MSENLEEKNITESSKYFYWKGRLFFFNVTIRTETGMKTQL